MKFGMNLLLWTGELNDDMIPVLEMLKETGYDGVELPIFNLDLDYATWGKRLDDLDLERTAVTIRGAEDNPISPDAAVRAKGVELSKKTTILFSPDLHSRLTQVAAQRRTSLGALVREACELQYGLRSKSERVRAVKALGELSLPVGTPEELAAESRLSPDDLMP